MRRILALACAGLLLAACATGPGDKGLTPRQSIYAAQGLLTGLESAATVYASLPRCVPGLVACSDPVVLAKMSGAKLAARGAVSAAVTIARDPNATNDKLLLALMTADAAVQVLQALIPAQAVQVSQ